MSAAQWNVHYESGQPPWETGQPSSELARVIAEYQTPPGRVIDLGCGSGINAVWLAQQGFEVTAVDFSELAIEKARQRAADAGVTVRFELADVLNLPEDLEPFPVFFDRGCYHVVRTIDVQGYLRSLKRIALPGARGLLLTGNARERREPGPPVVSEAELRAEVQPAFTIVRLREFRFDPHEGEEVGPLGWSCLVTRS